MWLQKLFYKCSFLQLQNTFSTLSQNVAASVPCADNSGPVTYLNKPEVKEALHVKLDLPEWGDCRYVLGLSFTNLKM